MPDTALVATGLVYAYVRESNSDDMDPAGQIRDCRALAVRYGYDPDAMVVVNDFGQSGRRIDRPGYVRIKADIEAGRVAVVLARSVDRLGRDAQESMAFEALALSHGTRVLTDRDGERTIDPESVNTLVRWLPALLAQEESRLGRDRARRGRITRLGNIEAHREVCTLGVRCTHAHHWDGRPPASPERLLAVCTAFAEAGSYNGAARIINATPGQRVEATTVQRIVRFAAANGLLPDIRLPHGRRGVRPMALHALSGLVRCPHDQSTLTTTWRSTRNGREVGLFCRQGRTTDGHPSPYNVAERVVLDWLMAASAAVLGVQFRYEVITEDVTSLIADLNEQLRRLGIAYRAGALDDGEFAAESERIRGDLARYERDREGNATWDHGIDWSLAPAALNQRLREVLRFIEMDPQTFRPTAVIWTRQPTVMDESASVVVRPRPGALGLSGEVLTAEEVAVGYAIPDERALRYENGWRLSFSMAAA